MADTNVFAFQSASNMRMRQTNDHGYQHDNVTFEDAAKSYLEHGGDNRYLPPIIGHFRDRPLRSIHPFDIREMASILYPDCKNSTLNRQGITPARSVISHGYDRGWCNAIRIRRFKEDAPKRKKPASPVWLHAFVRQADKDGMQHLSAVVIFMSQTGARVSEAVNLCWPEVNIAARTATLLKTKTGTNSVRHLTDEMIDRLYRLKETAGDHERVFRYRGRHGVNERIQAVCERAKISYKSSHACGRHSFATNAMDLGMDIRTAMKAGDWKSSSIFLEIYVHPRANAGRVAADRFNEYRFSSDI